ncbi:hypothetical protein D2T31_00160 [Sinirhodobacter populi]|uniref:Autotransporter domain-containing protein n=1 Tax=Paenirhodobacter populi TaxID=2306993 RepID=A0A443KI81_9RHOB|nr:autotransporter domain-containing protein [Sinirhodobacter populi]RWR32438.1 hypothetical protein D2T31_00160 [Sinirhodobacter populi]
MTIRSLIAGGILAAAAALPAFAQQAPGPAWPAPEQAQAPGPLAQRKGPPTTGVAAFQRVFGAAGLLTIWSANDTFGSTQSRINGGLSHYATAAAGGPQTGYRDKVSTLLTPISGLTAIGDGRSFLYAGLSMQSATSSKNITYSDSSVALLTLSYLRMPTDNLVWGIGLLGQSAHTDMKNNDGRINAGNLGLRGDLLYKFNEHWAVVNRFVYLNGNSDTKIPTPVGYVREDRDTSLLYYQGDLVGTFTDKDLGFLSPGWVLHPTLGVVTEQLTRDGATNNRGVTSQKQDVDYTAVSAILRLEKPVFAPGAWSPQVEIGLKHELHNSLGSYSDEDSYLYSLIGVGRRLSANGYFNAAYSRDDGFNGNRRTQTFKLIYSMSF